MLLLTRAVFAQEARSIKTAPDTHVALSFLLNQTANCDIGPIGLPRLTQAPSNGTIEMRIAHRMFRLWERVQRARFPPSRLFMYPKRTSSAPTPLPSRSRSEGATFRTGTRSRFNRG